MDGNSGGRKTMDMDTEVKPGPMDGAAGENGDTPSDDPEFDGVTVFSLGGYSDDDLLTKAGLAQLFKCSPRTLQRMVERFEVPPATPFGCRNIWIVGRLKAWILNMAETRESEALKHAKKTYRM